MKLVSAVLVGRTDRMRPIYLMLRSWHTLQHLEPGMLALSGVVLTVQRQA